MAQKLVQNNQFDVGSATAPNDNIIINGNFRIWQRGTLFTSVSASQYFADRWHYAHSGTGTVELFKLELPVDSTIHFDSSIRTRPLTINAGLGASDFYVVRQPIEGNNVSDLKFGLSNAKTITLSFWHSHTQTGTFCVGFRNDAQDRSYVVEYEQVGSNVWERTEITIPGDVVGTWATDNTAGLDVVFTIAMGTTFQTGSPNSWIPGNFLATANQVNGMDSTGNNFKIGDVKIEVGDVATDYTTRPFSEELAMCQRYYEKNYNLNVTPGTIAVAGNVRLFISNINNAIRTVSGQVEFKVDKRASPSMVGYSTITGASGVFSYGGTDRPVSMGIGVGTGESGFQWDVGSVALASSAVVDGMWTADAEL